tara:strand:+ start:313 stop:927 length:615 start_codon:yes stop_codon:yes gene_type:complete
MQIKKYHKDLKNIGTILIDKKNSFIEDKDFLFVEKNLKKIPREHIVIGDAGEKNNVDVCRLMTDLKKPKIVNKKYSTKVLDLLNVKYLPFFKKIVNKKKLYIRRAQVNFMKKNSFVGYHLDIDSNPDYLYAVVLQLGSKFTGGDYVVHKNKNKKNIFKPKYKSVILSDCKIPHEVTKVRSGERVSFVFFLSGHYKNNKRKDNAN